MMLGHSINDNEDWITYSIDSGSLEVVNASVNEFQCVDYSLLFPE